MSKGCNVYDRILITGGAGMLAQALAQALRRRGTDPLVRTRAQLDVADFGALSREVRIVRPTLVLNCAAYTKVDACEDPDSNAELINSDAPRELAVLSGEHGTKLIHFSTDFVFDGQSRRPYREDDTVHPLSAYGRSKLLGEQVLQESLRDNWMIIRTAWLYGPGGACFPQTILNAARAGKPLTVVNDQVGSPTFTRDLADATLRLIDAGATGTYHVVNAGQTTWYDFAVAILNEFGLRSEVTPISSAEWKAQRPTSAIRPAYSVLDNSKFEKATGHRMRHWREALGDYHDAIGA
jgi:dTDP-4-dehydrorhamnose reductase